MTKIDTAARSTHGDYHAAVRSLARFCTESLAEAAHYAREGMTQAERSKFVSSSEFSYGCDRRDIAVRILCGWVSCVQLREWSVAFEASCAAARAEFPAAYEAIGAAL